MTRRRGGDDGFSLIELLVTIIILAIVGTLTTSLMIGSMRTSRRQQEQSSSFVNAKVAMERITTDIRGANSMTYAAPRTITFVTTIGGIRRTTTYTVVTSGSNTEIRRTLVRRDLSTATQSTTTNKVLGGLAIGRSEAIFTYADGGGTALAPLTASPVTYPTGDVRSIGIRVVMRQESGSTGELYQLISIRNLED